MLIAMELQIQGYQDVGSRVTPDHQQLDLLSLSSGEASAGTASQYWQAGHSCVTLQKSTVVAGPPRSPETALFRESGGA